MKKIINCKLYDTDTSTLIFEKVKTYEKSETKENIPDVVTRVYQSKNKELYVYQEIDGKSDIFLDTKERIIDFIASLDIDKALELFPLEITEA